MRCCRLSFHAPPCFGARGACERVILRCCRVFAAIDADAAITLLEMPCCLLRISCDYFRRRLFYADDYFHVFHYIIDIFCRFATLLLFSSLSPSLLIFFVFFHARISFTLGIVGVVALSASIFLLMMRFAMPCLFSPLFISELPLRLMPAIIFSPPLLSPRGLLILRLRHFFFFFFFAALHDITDMIYSAPIFAATLLMLTLLPS